MEASQNVLELKSICVPEIRHFIYKSISVSQFLVSDLSPPYNIEHEFKRLEGLYYHLNHRLKNITNSLSFIYESKNHETMFAKVILIKLKKKKKKN